MNKKLPESYSKELQEVPLVGNEVFATYDLGCSTALVTAGFELITLDKVNPRRARFVFRREVGIEKIAEDFWSNRLEQKSRSYWDNIKTLKSRLYSNE